MKKTFPHKAHLTSTPTSYNSQSSLTNTLKAIVTSQLKIDKKSNDDLGRSMERTGSTRKPSITARLPKAMNQSTNSLLPQDESVRVIRTIIKEEILKEARLPFRQRTNVRDEPKESVVDPVADLRKEVAQLRQELNRRVGTGSRFDHTHSKNMGSTHCQNDTWTEKCFTQSSSQIASPSEFVIKTEELSKAKLERRLELIEEAAAENRSAITKEVNARVAVTQQDFQKRNSELMEKLLVCQSQQHQLRCQLMGMRNSIGVDREERLNRLESNMVGVMGRLDTLEYSKRDTPSSNIIQIRSYSSGTITDSGCCKKQAQELKKELSDMKSDVRSLYKLVAATNDQVDRQVSIESELREQIHKLEQKSDLKNVFDRVGDFEQQLGQFSQYLQVVECKVTKNFRQCEQAVTKFSQVESKIEQYVKRQQLQLVAADFKEVVDTLQSQINTKLMTIITEYNENFLSIENSICDLRDIFFQNLQINKNLTQKMQAVCSYQASESHQLQQLYKTSDDVYTLLENNIQRICELSKKEMCFQHEFKQLREKVEVADSQNYPRKRMTSSFSSSFSEMKSKIMGELKCDPQYPRESFKRLNLSNGRNMPTLMDESIQDQSGEFSQEISH